MNYEQQTALYDVLSTAISKAAMDWTIANGQSWSDVFDELEDMLHNIASTYEPDFYTPGADD